MTTDTTPDRASCLNLDSHHVKSYSTEANLVKAMNEWGIRKSRYQVVRTPRGRWTALIIGFQQDLLNSGWPMIG